MTQSEVTLIDGKLFEQDEVLDTINREANTMIADYIRNHPENIVHAFFWYVNIL